MHKWKAGKLHSGGPGGPVVHDQPQAVAIMLSEKRKEQANGGAYPEARASRLNKRHRKLMEASRG
jgi:hypothetical protein